jgi:hypothetical protein
LLSPVLPMKTGRDPFDHEQSVFAWGTIVLIHLPCQTYHLFEIEENVSRIIHYETLWDIMIHDDVPKIVRSSPFAMSWMSPNSRLVRGVLARWRISRVHHKRGFSMTISIDAFVEGHEHHQWMSQTVTVKVDGGLTLEFLREVRSRRRSYEIGHEISGWPVDPLTHFDIVCFCLKNTRRRESISSTQFTQFTNWVEDDPPAQIVTHQYLVSRAYKRITIYSRS